MYKGQGALGTEDIGNMGGVEPTESAKTGVDRGQRTGQRRQSGRSGRTEWRERPGWCRGVEVGVEVGIEVGVEVGVEVGAVLSRSVAG